MDSCSTLKPMMFVKYQSLTSHLKLLHIPFALKIITQILNVIYENCSLIPTYISTPTVNTGTTRASLDLSYSSSCFLHMFRILLSLLFIQFILHISAHCSITYNSQTNKKRGFLEYGRIGNTRNLSPYLDNNCTGKICLM